MIAAEPGLALKVEVKARGANRELKKVTLRFLIVAWQEIDSGTLSPMAVWSENWFAEPATKIVERVEDLADVEEIVSVLVTRPLSGGGLFGGPLLP